MSGHLALLWLAVLACTFILAYATGYHVISPWIRRRRARMSDPGDRDKA